jgi:hypothetical protein
MFELREHNGQLHVSLPYRELADQESLSQEPLPDGVSKLRFRVGTSSRKLLVALLVGAKTFALAFLAL